MDKWTEREMLDLLKEKYTKIRSGTNADRYVRAEHVPVREYPDMWYSGTRIVDYLVMDTYGEGCIIGHEVKVSRSDWLAELRDPNKSETWRQYCNKWYLVVPDASIVKDDLPEGWGLMVVGKNGGLRVRKQSSHQENTKNFTTQGLSVVARSVAVTASRESTRDAFFKEETKEMSTPHSV